MNALSNHRVYAGIAGFLLIVANLVAWAEIAQGNVLRVTFFSVGQGDSIFIETSQGHQILIDGGPNNAVVEKVAGELPFWDTSLDLVILTHPDADHITGLVPVLEQFKVENVLWTGVEKETNIFASWTRALKAENANNMIARAKQKIVWSQDPNTFMEIISPGEATVQNAKAVNDTSIVTILQYGEHSFLFPGDISRVVEQELVNKGVRIQASVLKVPHHGSKFSNTENFLEAVSPSVAVIQVGSKNHYGHPTEEVLERFSNFGIPVLRTDLNGDILIQSNGKSISVYAN